VSFQLARVAQIGRLSAHNICSDYHGREETIDDGEFIFDDLILCPQLPAKEKAAAQAGAPPIDFSALGSAGGCRRGEVTFASAAPALPRMRGDFIIDNPIPCFPLPAEENAQTGTAFDFSHSAPLWAVGTQRLRLVRQRCYGRCQR
jgi:hypothetical protein